MNWRGISWLAGQIFLAFCVTMVLPASWALWYAEWGSLGSFGAAALVSAGLGGLMLWRGDKNATLHRREALVVVGLSWFALPSIGAIPYILDGVFSSPVDALFESVSGFTTTGATVLTEIESAMSKSLHFWRMQTHWLGGMGIMVLFVAVLPSIGVGGKMLFKNEVPGPITEGLRPRIRQTSSALWRIYIVLTLAQTVLLMLFGDMDLWNASGHAMSTLGTGGFSTMNASIAGFDSAAVDVIITIFMFLAGVNFSLYFLVMQGRTTIALKDRELWAYGGLVLVASLVVSALILDRHDGHVGNALRYGFFQVVAIITTTGFGTDDFDAYPSLARTLLMLLLFVGGSAGSTAGGVKIFRFVVMAKSAWTQVRRTFQPQAVTVVKVRGVPIDDSVVQSISAFFFIYFSLFVLGTIVMSTMSPDLETAFTSTISCLGNVGPGLSAVGPTQNYAFFSPAAKLFLTLLMVFGRLEVFTLLVLFAPAFWKR